MQHTDRLRRSRLFVMMLTTTLLGAAWLHAQGVTPEAPAEAVPRVATPSIDMQTGKLPTITEMFNTSPVINSIIAFLSVVAVALFLYFLFTIHTRAFMPAAFMDDVNRLAGARQYEQASQYCRNHRHILAASILQRCFENADKEQTIRMAIIESEGQRRAGLVWNRISYLIDLSSIAPMLGLLGTVLGMIEAFFILPSQSAHVTSKLLAQAIGGAMTATFFGLSVAILCVVFHSIIKSRTLTALSEVEQSVQSIADQITPAAARPAGGAA